MASSPAGATTNPAATASFDMEAADAEAGAQLAALPPGGSPDGPTGAVAGPRLSPTHVMAGAREVGVAHWYGHRFIGRRTASGERMRREAMTAAHPYLPLGTLVRLTNLENGKTINVRINDRLKRGTGAIVDLTPGAAAKIGALRDPPAVALVVLSVPKD